jgi:hypothetical protein
MAARRNQGAAHGGKGVGVFMVQGSRLAPGMADFRRDRHLLIFRQIRRQPAAGASDASFIVASNFFKVDREHKSGGLSH